MRALRQVLGDHIAPRARWWRRKLRFDSCIPRRSRRKHWTAGGIDNDVVLENDEVITRMMAGADAATHGARALFGEHDGDEVGGDRWARLPASGSNLLGGSVSSCGGSSEAHRRYRP